MAAFVEQTQALRNAPSSNKQVRDYQRMLASGASDEIPDKQGRITIPPHLRAYAGLDKECVVVGAINRVEVWDAEAWQAYSARAGVGLRRDERRGVSRTVTRPDERHAAREAQHLARTARAARLQPEDPTPWHTFPGAR